MRLLVDLQTLQGPSADRGIGYYALSLVTELARSRPEHHVMALLDGGRAPTNINRVRHRMSPALSRDDVVLFPAPPGHARGSDRTAAETAASREATIAAVAPDAVLVTGAFELGLDAPLTFGQWCEGPPTAVVLHDLIPLLDLPHYKPDAPERTKYLETLHELSRADALLTNSDFSAAEAQRLLESCPPVSAIYGAAPTAAEAYRPGGAPDPGYVLAVAQDEPRKDVPTAVRAWARVPEGVRAGRAFVIVGTWQEDSRNRLRSLAREVGLSASALVFAGAVDDHELSWLYSNAALLVFPSLVEGLGLPPLQAMRAGTPALLSRSSSLLELVDDPAPYFATGDAGELSRLITRCLTDAEFHANLLNVASRSAAHFTWARTAELTWSALEKLARPTQLEPPRRSLALLGRAAEGDPDELRDMLTPSYDVTVVSPPDVKAFADGAWQFDRILYDLRAPVDQTLSASMADAPGVVLLDGMPPESDLTSETLLAPALAVLVPSEEIASQLLQEGCASTLVRVVPTTDDPSGSPWVDAVEEAYRSDVASRWAEALDGAAVTDGWSDILLRRPRWSLTPRRKVLVSDITLYRATPFLSGIQRAVARLHDSLRDIAHDRRAELLPALLGQSPAGTPHFAIAEDPVLSMTPTPVAAADWMLALDYNPDVISAAEQISLARAHGVGVAVMVYDLLPHNHPEWFPSPTAEDVYRPWLRGVLAFADVLLVNSMSTARDLERFVSAHPPDRPDAFAVHLLALGADFDQAHVPAAVERDVGHFLLVGTVEPRKGHRAVLDAFERLWARGEAVELTVLGRAGWMVDDVVDRMERLEVTQPAFRWRRGADDTELDLLYRTCSAAIVASEGEGFGLPVVEAAIRDCPVIARDIPVLREIAGDHATYFDDGQRLLADVVADVARHPERLGKAPLDSVRSWRHVAGSLLDVLDETGVPLACWSPESGWVAP